MNQSGFDWGLLGQQAGLGFVLGLSVGYSLKKAMRIALLLLGVLLTALVALSRAGFISIHWDVIERAYTSALTEAGGAGGAVERVIAWFSSSVAAAGSFSVGFWLGFRQG